MDLVLLFCVTIVALSLVATAIGIVSARRRLRAFYEYLDRVDSDTR